MKKNLKRFLYGLMASLYGVAVGLTAGICLTIATSQCSDVSTSLDAHHKNLQPINSSFEHSIYFSDAGYWLGDYVFVDPDYLESFTDEMWDYRYAEEQDVPGSLLTPQIVANDSNWYALPDYQSSTTAWVCILLSANGSYDDSNGNTGEYIWWSSFSFLFLCLNTYTASQFFNDWWGFTTSPFVLWYDVYHSNGWCVSNWNYYLTFEEDMDNVPDEIGFYSTATYFFDTMWTDCYIDTTELGYYLGNYAPSYSYNCQRAFIGGYDAGMMEGYGGAYEAGYGAGYNQGAQGQIVAVSSAYNQGYGNGYVEGLSDGKVIGYDSGYDVGYDSGYSVGYVAGYSSGYGQGASIYNDAYEAGYNYGYVTGKNVGYAQGLEANNDTSSAITSLFFSIASVPWTILNGLGTFEIWNVSIIAIALGFLVAGIIFWLIRRFI